MSTFPQLGKIQSEAFDELLLPWCGASRNEVSTGPAFGVDVAVVDLPGGMAMALASDPLSLIPSLGLQESAWLSVHLLANDMATTGCAPMYAQMVLNLPATFPAEDFKTYWQYIHKYCKEIAVAITGGHTGWIEGQNSTIAGGGTMVLVNAKEKILTSQKARPGNVILMTKSCALSSSAILAMSFPNMVKNKLGAEVYEQGCVAFYETSSLKAGLTAAKNNGVRAMHDVTEGGVLGALYEMAKASHCGLRVNKKALPVAYAQEKICTLFGLEPASCIGAGAMLIAVQQGTEASVIEDLRAAKIEATIIGEMTEAREGMLLVEEERTFPLEYISKDPYWDAFFTALKKGWS